MPISVEGIGGDEGAVEPLGGMAVSGDDHRHGAKRGDPGEVPRRTSGCRR